MPSGVDDAAAQVLNSLIFVEYRAQQPEHILQYCMPRGASGYKLSRGRVKQPNQSFASNTRQIDALPVLVVEVGASESYTQLKRDAAGWLETGEVHIVILVIVQWGPSKALFIEIWESTPSNQPSDAADVPAFVGRLRGGARSSILVLNYADFGIPNIPGALTVPMAEWSTLVWTVLSQHENNNEYITVSLTDAPS
ncbi:hypothetical protein B0H16DRAFT_1558015 [Mycena metata]|uniref:Restriction endonuclease domain-containing protein n=1 Tax=Mycena metata TaxID=1033252 RepID=A0AAD7IL77_9AGAR|nr:hypothetical protein B0H16DRAFT_1558015 [Mycena metata]